MGYTPHVLVIGGGVTGTGIARDLAIRGLDVTLVERGRLTDGATGRMQGLLYSGARYTDADPAVAKQCYAENRTLAEIATHCVEETGGLLVSTDADDDAFDSLVEACRDCDIPAEELTGEEARELEPALGENIERAVRVPDATVDPFRLTVATAHSAMEFGAEIRTHTEVTEIHVEDGAVEAVTVEHEPEPTGRSGMAAAAADDDGGDQDDDAESVDEPAAGADGADEESPGSVGPDWGPAGGTSFSTDPEGDEESDGDGSDGDEPDGDEPDTAPDGGKQLPGSTGGSGATAPGEAGDVPGMPGATGDEEQSRPAGETERLDPDYVVNATGAWVDQVAALAGFSFPMHRSRAAMVVTDDQPTGMPVSHGVTAGPVRTVVPHGEHCVVGATNDPVADPDNLDGDGEDAERLVTDLSEVVPDLAVSRVLRTFWGIRSGPPGEGGEGRRYALVDHADRDGCWGMTTVVGGTLTTHRRVAERVADHVCGKFGISRECRTDELTLPGSEDQAVLDVVMDTFGLSSPVYERSRDRLGSRTPAVLETDGPNPVVCDAEGVTRAEIRDALDDASAAEVDLNDVRIRTAATMGSCQGGRCAHRIAAELHPEYELDVIADALDDLLAERWKGQRHALWGDQLAQAARNYAFHASTLGRKYPHREGDSGLDIDGFDDGPASDRGEQPTAGWGMRR